MVQSDLVTQRAKIAELVVSFEGHLASIRTLAQWLLTAFITISCVLRIGFELPATRLEQSQRFDRWQRRRLFRQRVTARQPSRASLASLEVLEPAAFNGAADSPRDRAPRDA